jgi:MoaA/NifB/PqqE/SkfB family radical SAM enzyme
MIDPVDSINLDISNKCTLLCPFCSRQDLEFKKYKSLTSDMSLKQFIKIAKSIKNLTLCGQISDPIFNKQLINMLKFSYKNNNSISIHTAANHPNQNWYEEAFKANPNAFWTFGIDGLPSKDNPHRINQKPILLFNAMVLAKSMNMNCYWQCIIFSFNEQDLEQIQNLAKKINVPLTLIYSNRFTENSKLKPSTGLYVKKIFDKKKEGQLKPKCLEGAEYGYSAMGYITPCCWIDEGNIEKQYPDFFNKNTHINNFKNIKQLLNTKEWKNFQEILKNHPEKAPQKCWDKCSTKSGEHKKYLRIT